MVLAALLPAYKTKTAGTNAAKVLLDAVGDTIIVEAFRQYTVEDLVDDMAVSSHVGSPVHTYLSQHKPERNSSTPHFAGVRLLPPRPPLTKWRSANVKLTLQLRSTTSRRGQGQDTQPGPPIAPPRFIPKGTHIPCVPQCVTEMSTCGLHLSYPRIGGGNTEPHLRNSKEDILTSLPIIHIIDDWIHALHTHSHEDFAALFNTYTDDNCTPY